MQAVPPRWNCEIDYAERKEDSVLEKREAEDNAATRCSAAGPAQAGPADGCAGHGAEPMDS